MQKIVSYLDQLDLRAANLGLDLTEVCKKEGIAATTLMRWRKGEATCRQGTAEKLFKRMDAMAAAKRKSDQERAA